MLSLKTDIPVNKIFDLFCNESGYQTPKVDTRAAVFVDGKILLVHENNGTWSLPGGWCDVDQSVASNTEKEVQDQVGYECFDIVVANILADVLVPLTPVIVNQMKKGGIYRDFVDVRQRACAWMV